MRSLAIAAAFAVTPAFAAEPGPPAQPPAAAPAAAPAAEEPLKFGMSSAPTNAATAAKQAKMLEPYLTKTLKRKVTVTVVADYGTLAEDLAAGKLDAGWMQPLAYVRSRAKSDKVTAVSKLIRNGATFYRSVLYAKAGTGPKTLADLKGKRAAWVDKHSTSGYLFPLVLLHAQGYDADKTFAGQDFFGDHLSACKAVAAGKADVGATYADVPAEGKAIEIDGCKGGADLKKLAIVDMSGTITNDVIAVRPELPGDIAMELQTACIDMGKDKDGKKLLKEVFEADGFVPAAEGDFSAVARAWEIIRDMGKLDVTEK